MGYNFDGTDDIAQNTSFAALDSGDWTIAGWFRAETLGEVNGRIVEIAQTGMVRQLVDLLAESGGLVSVRGVQAYGTTNAGSTSTVAVPLNTWAHLVVVFTEADATIRMWLGTERVPHAEVSYDSQTAGVGSRTTGANRVNIGNSNATARTFDGDIAHVAVSAYAWTAVERETHRLLGAPPSSGLRGDWRLASDANDSSGNGYNLTVTGAVLGDHPVPVPPFVPRVFLSA